MRKQREYGTFIIEDRNSLASDGKQIFVESRKENDVVRATNTCSPDI